MAANDPATDGTLWRMYSELLAVLSFALKWFFALTLLGSIAMLMKDNGLFMLAGVLAGLGMATLVVADAAAKARREYRDRAAPTYLR